MKGKKNNFITRVLITSSLYLSLSACSLLSGNTPPTPEAVTTKPSETTSVPTNAATPKTAKVTIESLAEKKSSTLSDIEILWQIPVQPVEGFVINYGYDKAILDLNVKIATKDLEKFEDPKHGFVYRYVLGDVPLSKTVYVSIAAYNGTKVSLPSEIFPVSGETIGK